MKLPVHRKSSLGYHYLVIAGKVYFGRLCQYNYL